MFTFHMLSLRHVHIKPQNGPLSLIETLLRFDKQLFLLCHVERMFYTSNLGLNLTQIKTETFKIKPVMKFNFVLSAKSFSNILQTVSAGPCGARRGRGGTRLAARINRDLMPL